MRIHALYLDCRKRAQKGEITYNSEQIYYKSEVLKPSRTFAENCWLQRDQGGTFGILFNFCVTIVPRGSGKIRAS